MLTKNVYLDRDTGDFAMELNGEIVGYRRTRYEAETALDAIVYERLTHEQPADAGELVSDPATWQAVSEPRCELCGEPAVLVGEQWTCPECAPIGPDFNPGVLVGRRTEARANDGSTVVIIERFPIPEPAPITTIEQAAYHVGMALIEAGAESEPAPCCEHCGEVMSEPADAQLVDGEMWCPGCVDKSEAERLCVELTQVHTALAAAEDRPALAHALTLAHESLIARVRALGYEAVNNGNGRFFAWRVTPPMITVLLPCVEVA